MAQIIELSEGRRLRKRRLQKRLSAVFAPVVKNLLEESGCRWQREIGKIFFFKEEIRAELCPEGRNKQCRKLSISEFEVSLVVSFRKATLVNFDKQLGGLFEGVPEGKDACLGVCNFWLSKTEMLKVLVKSRERENDQ